MFEGRRMKNKVGIFLSQQGFDQPLVPHITQNESHHISLIAGIKFAPQRINRLF